MAGSAVLALDDLIRKPDTNATIPTGLALYGALCASTRVVLLAGEDRAATEWFLANNGLKAHAQVVYEDRYSGSSAAERRVAQARTVRAGSSVDLIVDTDPEVAAALLEDGFATLLFLHPRYTRPSLRPDVGREATPWSSLIETIRFQEHLRVHDHRTEHDDE